jgi:hypothetical protein
VLAEEVMSPFSELNDSVALVLGENSVGVLLFPLDLVVGALHDISLVSLVDDPVGEVGLEGDELSLVRQTEVESSESDEVADLLGLWSRLNSVRVEVDGDELVELDVLVGDVGLEVEGWVNDLDLGNELILVFELEWFADVDNDTEAVYFVSAIFILCSFSLTLGK